MSRHPFTFPKDQAEAILDRLRQPGSQVLGPAPRPNVKTTTNWVRRTSGPWHIVAGRWGYNERGTYGRPTACGAFLHGDLGRVVSAGPDGPRSGPACADCVAWAKAPREAVR